MYLIRNHPIFAAGKLFTGIIEETGRVRALRRRIDGAVLTVDAKSVVSGSKAGDSIAVNGACFTVTECDTAGFSCDLSPETLERTTFGRAKEGMVVNLERPLSLGARLGGHFVLGHVDGIGRLRSRNSGGEGSILFFEYPVALARFLVFKGSVAVDGVSLTIASLEQSTFSAAVIPYTIKMTDLGQLQPGDAVNLEVDILGKYVERFFRLGLAPGGGPSLTAAYLKEQGF